MARTITSTPALLRDPAPGSALTVADDGHGRIELNLTNGSPDVAAFYLECEGLDPKWVQGVGPANETLAAAFGDCVLTADIRVPKAAPAGDHPFTLRIMSGGSPIGDPLPLVLRIEGAAPAVPAPTPEPVVLAPEPVAPVVEEIAPAPAPDPEPVVVPAPEPPRPEPKPQPVAETPRPEPKPEPVIAAPVPAPEPVVQKAPEPIIAPAPAPKSAPETKPVPKPAPAPEPRPAVVFAPEPKPTPAPAPVAPPVQAETPKPTPAPAPRPVVPPAPQPVSYADDEPDAVLVDVANPTVTTDHPADEDDHKAAEPEYLTITDPAEGQAVAVKPGEIVQVRFPVTNDTGRTRTYILDEDRSLGTGWLTLVRDQVNLTKNGVGDLAFRLSPPTDAEPGDYPFTVTLGPEGGPLASRTLVLSVQATPAVHLTAKQTTVKVGPFVTSAIPFELTVDSAGNADTAFRLGVLADQAETEGEDTVGRREYQYETANWRYLFEKEMDSLRAPAAGRAPRPVPLRLTLQRRGAWWFGFKESQTVKVAAVPVTDPGNGGKTANSVTLTAVRWRLLPFPALLLLPILMLFGVLLTGGASNVDIMNAQRYGDVAYVLQTENIAEDPNKPDVPMSAQLEWSAPWYSLLTLKATTDNAADNKGFVHGHFTDNYQVKEYGKDRTYTLSPLLVAGATGVTARFVPVRTDHKLQITTGNEMRPVAEKPEDLTIGEATVPSGASSVTVDVPKNGTLRLNLKNATPAARGLRVEVWLVHQPTDFSVSNVTATNTNSVGPGQFVTAQIKYKPTGELDANNELTLVTTDAGHQIVHVHLRAH